mgnify:CR=1 FL=1
METFETMRKRLQDLKQEAEDLKVRCEEAKAKAEEIKERRQNQQSLKDRVSMLTVSLQEAQEGDRVAQEHGKQILDLLQETLQDIKKKRKEDLERLHANLQQKLVGASLLHQEASTILDHLEHK